MGELNKRNVFEQGLETFSWLRGTAPDIPSEFNSTLEEEFQKLRTIIKLAADYVVEEDSKRSLKFCEEDMNEAEKHYKLRDKVTATKHLLSARKLFEEARSDKRSRPTFIAGPDGTTKVSE